MSYRKVLPAAWCAAIFLTAAALAAPPAGAPAKVEAEQKSQFLRLLRDSEEMPVALQAAIVRFAPPQRPAQGPTVDLVAAVHVAEKSYYRLLNREFRKYDAVLFELVAPEGTQVPKGGQSGGSPVSAIQRGMKSVLELEFQLEQIDYTEKNMVHADMSPEQFAQSMRRRGESFFGMFLRMLGYAMAQQNRSGGQATDLQLLMALFDKNRALALKRVMAEQFEDMEGILLALDGPDGSTMISERNKVALQVLRKQVASGKRKFAIFYGAGHMPDLQQRLREDFGLAPVSTRWVNAWNLKAPQRPKATEKTKAPEKPEAAEKPEAPEKSADDGNHQPAGASGAVLERL